MSSFLSFLHLFKGFKEKNRPVLGIELLFDIVIVALLGGVSHKIVVLIPEIGTQAIFTSSLIYYLLELVTVLIFWRVIMLHALRQGDNLNLRFTKFVIMIPLLFQAVSTYLQGDEEIIIDIAQRMNAYSYMAGCLVITTVYFAAGFSEKKGERAHHFIVATLFLLSALTIPAAVEVGAFLNNDPANQDLQIGITLGDWIGSLVLIIVCQIIAGQKRFHEHKRPKLENLKERYNVLFIIFLGEYFITIITHLAEGTSKRVINNIPIFFLAIILAFGLWWVFNDVMNYFDIRRTDNAQIIFSFAISVCLIGILLMADGMALAMHEHAPGKNYHKYGVYAFISGLIVLILSFGSIWFAVKQYGTLKRVIFTRKMQIINLAFLPFFLGGAIAGAVVTNELIISLVIAILMCTLFAGVQIYFWARRWRNPVSEEQFRKEIAHFKYRDQWVEEH